jgi:hypothetical protein
LGGSFSRLAGAIVALTFGVGSWAGTQGPAKETDTAHPVDRYNVVWRTPSQDSSGSMPIGNGDIGLNVWVEKDGDLLFYIGKTDAWSENAALLKLGRVRIHLSPNPFRQGMPFLQTLRLAQGEIEICAGGLGSQITLKLWVDANHPVIRVEAAGRQDFEVRASLEVWRSREREIQGQETAGIGQSANGPHRVVVYPDTILPAQGNRIIWFHRNNKSAWPANMEVQGMESFMKQSSDPLLNRTFGGVIQGDGLVTENSMTLKSVEPGEQMTISIYPLTKQTGTVKEWIEQVNHDIGRIKAQDLESARKAHRKWWRDFWDRSWIRVTGSEEAETVSLGYTLQRFMNACGGRGDFPIKFNGGIFTVDA